MVRGLLGFEATHRRIPGTRGALWGRWCTRRLWRVGTCATQAYQVLLHPAPYSTPGTFRKRWTLFFSRYTFQGSPYADQFLLVVFDILLAIRPTRGHPNHIGDTLHHP